MTVSVEGHSTGGDRRLRSLCHPVCCVCAVQVNSAIHWNPIAAGLMKRYGQWHVPFPCIAYDTIRYDIFTCAHKLTIWPA